MDNGSQRIDKWLWHARIFKTRSLAQKAVSSGKVRVDREKVTSPSFKLKPEHVITVALKTQVKILKVLAFSQRRVSYPLACKLYTDLTPQPETPGKTKEADFSGKPVTLGKPDKRQRREAMKIKRNHDSEGFPLPNEECQ